MTKKQAQKIIEYWMREFNFSYPIECLSIASDEKENLRAALKKVGFKVEKKSNGNREENDNICSSEQEN
jgi:hypothetical protein